ncbi:MAG: DUF2244 domain-containing protein [Hyphomicrobiaceae bacterium]|nr:DUF2244 domain-containing protein [Hyphomicrobiaceae bacterium]
MFSAILTPYRSLSKPGFLVLMAFLGVVSFAVGLYFLSLGAWPVLGFFGLDILLVLIAFKLNYRSGREYEVVRLTPSLLTLTRVDPGGRAQVFDFNPYWVRVNLSEHHDGRTRLCLASHGEELVFGCFLTDDERKDFAGVLRTALSSARSARSTL